MANKIEKKVTFDDVASGGYRNTFKVKEQQAAAHTSEARNNKILVSLSDSEYDLFLEKKEAYRKSLGMKKNLADAVYIREIVLKD
jgi:hypothetical protein